MVPIDPKLVRDGIPGHIAKKGNECRWRVAAAHEHVLLLLEKLVEEVGELSAVLGDPDAAEAELADVFEVLDALILELKENRHAIQILAPDRKPLKNAAKEYLPTLLRESAKTLLDGFTVKPNLSVLGDVIRNVEELIPAFGFSRARVITLQRQKRERVGGFTQWIVLEAC